MINNVNTVQKLDIFVIQEKEHKQKESGSEEDLKGDKLIDLKPCNRTGKLSSIKILDRQISVEIAIKFYFNAHLYSQSVVAYWITKGKQTKLLYDGYKKNVLTNIFERVKFKYLCI